jgi:hypothetical protein
MQQDNAISESSHMFVFDLCTQLLKCLALILSVTIFKPEGSLSVEHIQYLLVGACDLNFFR